MKFINKPLTHLLKILPGGYWGIFSVLFSLFGDFVAVILFPTYSMFRYDISYLANGPGGIFFNFGLLFSGILAIPFNVHLGKIVKNGKINERIRKSAIIISIIASVSLALIGFFPAYPDNLIILVIHGIFAFIFFLSVTIVLVIYGYFFLKNDKFLKIQAYISFLIATSILIYIALRWPILEWIAMIGIMISVLLTSIFMLYKGY